MKLEWFENILGYLVHCCFSVNYMYLWRSYIAVFIQDILAAANSIGNPSWKKMRFEARLKLKNGSNYFLPPLISFYICMIVQLLTPLHVRTIVKPNYKFVSYKFFSNEQITVEWRMLLGILLWEIFALKLKRNSVFFPSPLILIFVILQKLIFLVR